MAKHIIILIFTCTSLGLFSQNQMPTFLAGTWKMDNKDGFERWDIINDSLLTGFSYFVQKDQIVVIEYLSIKIVGKNLIYSAIVLNQNSRKPIDFLLKENDSLWIFENLEHDFPKNIIYKKLSDNEIFVKIEDKIGNGFGYKMVLENKKEDEKEVEKTNTSYDPELAQKLKADDYGMKNYVLVILKTGNNKTNDTAIVNRCFRSHFENIEKMQEANQLIVAGPIGKNDKSYRGIFILNANSFDEAKTILQNDESIKENLLEPEFYNWYGSAALPLYLELADKIWKIKP